MDFGALLGAAGGSIAGDIIGMVHSGKEASKARRWASQMSSTAHQREVADLRAAGLNPILSAGGSGASTPGASMATQSGVDVGKGINSAIALKMADANLSQVKQITEKEKVQTQIEKFKNEINQDALKIYRSDPKLRREILGVKLLEQAGSKFPDMGVFYNSASALSSWNKKWGDWNRRVAGSWKEAISSAWSGKKISDYEKMKQRAALRRRKISSESEMRKKYPMMNRGMKQ